MKIEINLRDCISRERVEEIVEHIGTLANVYEEIKDIQVKP